MVDDAQVRKFQRELASGTMALILLASLSRATEPQYGYQIAKGLEELGSERTAGKQSAIYPVLRNMSAAGLLESWVEPSVSGPPRRYYRITDAGRETLNEWCAIWEGTREFVETVLRSNNDE